MKKNSKIIQKNNFLFIKLNFNPKIKKSKKKKKTQKKKKCQTQKSFKTMLK